MRSNSSSANEEFANSRDTVMISSVEMLSVAQGCDKEVRRLGEHFGALSTCITRQKRAASVYYLQGKKLRRGES